jgi:ABC-type transport system involved in multi-copper enzyme maturation permease subunit
VQQFFAILKDSFREAVDGFVIYAMLVLSALLIVAAASLSFKPVEPDRAFKAIVQQFPIVVPEKGRSRAVMIGGDVSYSTSDAQKTGDGYKVRLTVTADGKGSEFTAEEEGKTVRGDAFRATVARWAMATGDTIKVDEKGKMRKGGRGRGVEVAGTRFVSVAEQRAVTDAQLEEFIKGQFLMHADMNSTVTRVKGGVEEPKYEFDVTTSGGSAVKGWPHETKVLFGMFTLADEGSLGATLWLIEDVVINRFGGTFTLLIGMIITAFFIPNMLRKGSVDLLISKPIGRSQLLVYKYIGGLTFMFLVTAFTVGGIWFVLAIRSGYWSPAFLAAIPILTFTFAILYAVSTLVAVFTRSAIAAMLMTVGFSFFLFVFGQVKATYDDNRADNPDAERPAWQATVVDGGNDFLPRYRDLDQLLRRLIVDGTLTPAMQRLVAPAPENPPSLVGIFGVSLLHIAWMLGLSCWWFSTRDY